MEPTIKQNIRHENVTKMTVVEIYVQMPDLDGSITDIFARHFAEAQKEAEAVSAKQRGGE